MMSHRHNWPARPDEGHRMRMTIGDLARAAAPPGWSRLTVRRSQVGAHALTTLICDGREVAAEGVDEQFQRLRELSYRADAGTWFTCELEFTAGSRGYTGHVDSSAPPFADVPAPAALAELTLFPHEEPPGWLLAALPTAAPIALPTAYGDRRHRRHRHSDHEPPPPPPAPITGELAYRPATAMTAHVFEHHQEPDLHDVYLTGQADEPECLLVGCSANALWASRGGTRGTGGGMRSITLDGEVLRLELTPEAADALETETAFEVRLDMPPEMTARLAAVLPGMLRRVTGAPELIGF
ncbi:hypothetical protein MTP10_20890 [Nonomuraea sp. 3-1Str]|uniref:hypothetical protein n=1 Tax=Nonomuraea sp. 3-1Str TaxID=2929801 RepID=UPI00285454F5|nr:hypothetical protein [Nonomuraea sp. 3-1Str]MDR8411177.1 hypothetical protein [Nonomuraea sp. 3-1Str]